MTPQKFKSPKQWLPTCASRTPRVPAHWSGSPPHQLKVRDRWGGGGEAAVGRSRPGSGVHRFPFGNKSHGWKFEEEGGELHAPGCSMDGRPVKPGPGLGEPEAQRQRRQDLLELGRSFHPLLHASGLPSF